MLEVTAGGLKGNALLSRDLFAMKNVGGGAARCRQARPMKHRGDRIVMAFMGVHRTATASLILEEIDLLSRICGEIEKLCVHYLRDKCGPGKREVGNIY